MSITNLPLAGGAPFYRGDSYTFDVTVTLSGAALNISAYSIWCTGKRLVSDADASAVFQITKAGGAITVTGTDSNVARVTIPPASTSALTDNTALFYDVQIKSAAGVVTTVASGTLTITRDITQTS